ncbi:MAG: molybdopterin-dependent oxidoreductase [Renibacterium salmoninarum]|nr:molybdopterin-dependent oxidoreductase [Renibacterium salmoninarum]
MSQRVLDGWAFLSGVLAVAFGVLAGELLAGWLSPSVSPVSAVGSMVIDGLPPGVKDLAISLFGTADKVVFLLVMAVVIGVAAGLAGVFEAHRKNAGWLLVAGFGLLGAAAVFARAQGNTVALAPPVVAALLSVALLRIAIARLRDWRTAQADPTVSLETGRRRFFQVLGASAAGALLTGLATGVVRGSVASYQAARDKLKLPAPAEPAAPIPAAPIPAAAQLEVPGLRPLVIPNDQFYRIDTALAVPVINPDDWQLKITGMVDREVSITMAELLAQPMIERYVTIACVSNEVGGDLIGNARWLGWPVREFLARAGVQPGADMVLSRSQDGFTASTPIEALTDDRDSIIAVGMNGQLLPLEHGFPARLIVPGLYGYVSATKWLTELKVTTFQADLAYWSTRGWSERGPIKQSSRIDTPRSGAAVSSGKLVLAGSAWAQTTGISEVQVQVDDGQWQSATLAAGISKDTWVQWSAAVEVAPGQHRVQVRSVDAAGQPQRAEYAAPAPDGSSGYHAIRINAQ